MELKLTEVESELSFLKSTQVDSLDRFDKKFDEITTELSKMKNENISLKEKERVMKREFKNSTESSQEWKEKCHFAEKKTIDISNRLQDIESEMKCLLIERERDLRESALRSNIEVRTGQENKQEVLGDI
jgi:hypothetical protein